MPAKAQFACRSIILFFSISVHFHRD